MLKPALGCLFSPMATARNSLAAQYAVKVRGFLNAAVAAHRDISPHDRPCHDKSPIPSANFHESFSGSWHFSSQYLFRSATLAPRWYAVQRPGSVLLA